MTNWFQIWKNINVCMKIYIYNLLAIKEATNKPRMCINTNVTVNLDLMPVLGSLKNTY